MQQANESTINARPRGEPSARADWVQRCIRQLQIADPALSEHEAADVARELFAFERTGAMPPENAVEFVVAQLATPTPRFERRSPNRLSTLRART